jgi:hypothetical protein
MNPAQNGISPPAGSPLRGFEAIAWRWRMSWPWELSDLLAKWAEEDRIEKLIDDKLRQHREDTQSDSGKTRNIIDERHRNHVLLSDYILKELKLETFLKDNPGVSRTGLTDYRAGRFTTIQKNGKVKKNIGTETRAKIEAAIVLSAQKLGILEESR